MWRVHILMFCCTFAAGSAAAETFECRTHQVAILADAVDTAEVLSRQAAGAVGDTQRYRRWFGAYSDSNAAEVRRGLKRIVSTLQSGAVTMECETKTDDGCDQGEFAWISLNNPNHIYICPRFFSLPSMAEVDRTNPAHAFGTRAGTIIHEVSHFRDVAGTYDHCYARTPCATMAKSAPDLAIDNADSFQYFAEDVAIFSR